MFITHKISSAKYNFIVAIESMIDLCNHIIAQNGYRTPEDYSDTFKVLSGKGAFDEEYTNTLIKITCFRNRLVHIYWEVDSDELYKILQTGIQDIKTFPKKFGAFLQL